VANPSPIVIDFVVRDLDKVLRAMKSISDVVIGTERTSVAAAKAGARSRVSEVEKEAKAKIEAMKKADRWASQAQAVGLREAARRHRLEAQEAANAAKAKIAAMKKADAVVEQSHRASAREASKAARTAEMAERKRHNQAIKDAQARQDFSVKIAQKLEQEMRRERFDARRGGSSALPQFSAAARLRELESARHKSPEEKQKALAKVSDMREEAKLANKRAAEQARIDAANGVIAKREGDRSLKDLEADARRRNAIRERSALLAGRYAKEQADKEIAERKRVAAEENRRREAFGRTATNASGNIVRGATSITGAVLRGVANIGGSFSIEDSVQREVQAQGLAAQIASSTNTGITAGELLTKSRAVAIEQGIDSHDVLRGYEQVKKLNDDALPQALRVMPDIAKIANVTGTDMGHMGELAANITASHAGETYIDEYGRMRKGISDEGLKRQLRVFSRQGIEGGVEVADFAKYGSRITAGAGLFAGDRTSAEANLGMSAQVARQFGSAATPAEATMAAQRMATDMQKKAGRLKEMGVDVVDHNDPKGGFRSMEDIMVDMLKNKNKVTEISEFKIGERGNRVLTGFADIYNSAGGGAAGEKAVRAQFAKGRKEIAEAEIEARNKKRNEAVDKQLNIAMTKLRIEVGTKLVPAMIPLVGQLTKLMPTISRLLDALGMLADFAAKNPLAGLGAALSVAISKEVATAGLRAGFEKAFASSLGGAGLSVASAVVAITAATIAVQQMSEAENQRQAKGVESDINLANATALLRPGATPADLTKAREAKAQAEASLADREQNKGGSSVYYGAALIGAGARDLFNTMTSTNLQGGATNQNLNSVREARAQQMAVDEKAIADQRQALDKFNKQLEAAAERLNRVAVTNVPAPSSPNGSLAGRRPNGG
jgi:hypothetical protein